MADRTFLKNIIDLIIVLSIKDIKINGKYKPLLVINCFG